MIEDAAEFDEELAQNDTGFDETTIEEMDEGKLEEVSDSITELSKKYPEYQPPGISISANKLNRHKDKYFRKYT